MERKEEAEVGMFRIAGKSRGKCTKGRMERRGEAEAEEREYSKTPGKTRN